MKKLLATLSGFAIVLGVSAAPFVSQAATTTVAGAIGSTAIVPIAQIQPGDLIRGQSFPAVYYYGLDGFRYVFPNSATYFTWYPDFSTVKWVSDTDLSTIQIGGNVTYKPGVRMVKIVSAPQTYAVDAGGTLRWVATETAAVALYGQDWNKQIDDLPDAYYSNYKMGADIDSAADFNPSTASTSATSIDFDKGLKAPVVIGLTDTGFSSTSITISAGEVVKFVNNSTSENHVATAADLSWGTGTLTPGQSFEHRFKTAGTYSYSDTLYPQFTGTVNVQ